MTVMAASTSEVGAAGLALSLVLVAAAVALSRWQHLRLERDLVVSVVRSIVQLLIVGAALQLVVDPGAWLGWSWLWVAGIVVFAAAHGGPPRARAARRPADRPGGERGEHGGRMAVTFGFGIFPVDGRTIVPVAGMLVGNALKSGVVAGRRLGRRDRAGPRGDRGAPGARPAVRRGRAARRARDAAHGDLAADREHQGARASSSCPGR